MNVNNHLFFETRRKNWLLRLYRKFVLLFETKFDWIHHQRRKYKYFYLETKVHEKYELIWNKINLNNIEIMKQIMLNLKYHVPTFPLKVILYMCTLKCSYAFLYAFKAFLYTFKVNPREPIFFVVVINSREICKISFNSAWPRLLLSLFVTPVPINSRQISRLESHCS